MANDVQRATPARIPIFVVYPFSRVSVPCLFGTLSPRALALCAPLSVCPLRFASRTRRVEVSVSVGSSTVTASSSSRAEALGRRA
eukprot:scaffold7381_cov310-Pinguiococcus_pyrenoidosus.AAC.85